VSKNKLQKIEEINTYSHVFQYPFAVLQEKNFDMKGKWNELFFKNNRPVVIELGCGKGEYTVGLAKRFPEKNFIGIDIKGARIWSGATQAKQENLKNVAFIRTRIELIDRFFAPGEVSEIWLTFPDPQMKKVNKRMTSTRFMKLYSLILKENGEIHLKTDSRFMFTYTCEMAKANHFPVSVQTDNLYESQSADKILSIKTFYEQKWLERGIPVKYIRFTLETRETYVEPQSAIERDTYNSKGRVSRLAVRDKSHHDTVYPRLIIEALGKVRYPGTGKSIVEMGMIGDDMRIEGNKASFSMLFEKPNDPFMKSLIKASETAILTYVGENIDIKGNIHPKTKQVAHPDPPCLLPGVKNIIAISSGKGGVGKSTIAANLAVALAKLGYKVGLLDADIFGPSVPKMFHAEEARPCMEKTGERELIVPVEQYGVKILSIGFFINKQDALVWRGTMAGNALKQLITDACWGELDYFLLDLPPGTSDIHLTLVQTLAITGVVIVTTPQEVALADARKGISMFTGKKINVPVIGLVENMAWFTPAELPENKYYIFGKDGGKHLSEEMHIPLLGQIPIVGSICEGSDSGKPVALNDSATGEIFQSLAAKTVEQVEIRNKNLSVTERVKMVNSCYASP
jgi:ATP-binding protein involved in chromosome partitioning